MHAQYAFFVLNNVREYIPVYTHKCTCGSHASLVLSPFNQPPPLPSFNFSQVTIQIDVIHRFSDFSVCYIHTL